MTKKRPLSVGEIEEELRADRVKMEIFHSLRSLPEKKQKEVVRELTAFLKKRTTRG